VKSSGSSTLYCGGATNPLDPSQPIQGSIEFNNVAEIIALIQQRMHGESVSNQLSEAARERLKDLWAEGLRMEMLPRHPNDFP